YWAVCTTQGTRFGGWDVDEFFATGEVEVAEILAAAERLGVPRARGAALDFGCGLGRLTRALATRFDRTVGVDISPRMVDRARTLTPDPACEFRVNSGADLAGLADGACDLVLSSVVLQHVPQRRWIEAYLREFARVVCPGGASDALLRDSGGRPSHRNRSLFATHGVVSRNRLLLAGRSAAPR